MTPRRPERMHMKNIWHPGQSLIIAIFLKVIIIVETVQFGTLMFLSVIAVFILEMQRPL